MAAKKNNQLKVSCVTDLYIDEQAWRAAMVAHGIDMTGVVTAAHIQRVVRFILSKQFDLLGFRQEHME